MRLAEKQRQTRTQLAAQRIQEGKTPAALQVTAIEGERRKADVDLGPVRYLASLIGAGDQGVLRW
jgi:hypothetical protein